MGLTNEHVGPRILAKIKIYVLTRAELLITLCYEIPCSWKRTWLHPRPDPKILFWLKYNVETLNSAEFKHFKCKQKYVRTNSGGLEVDLELRKKDNGNFSKLQDVCSSQCKETCLLACCWRIIFKALFPCSGCMKIPFFSCQFNFCSPYH